MLIEKHLLVKCFYQKAFLFESVRRKIPNSKKPTHPAGMAKPIHKEPLRITAGKQTKRRNQSFFETRNKETFISCNLF